MAAPTPAPAAAPVPGAMPPMPGPMGMPPMMPGMPMPGAPFMPPPNPGTPNNTIYINNLNEKVKIEELKRSLFHVCSQYGVVIDIIAGKSLKRRGQAFIVYDEVKSAVAAACALQGFNFYGKPMRVAFAKSKSDIIAKREGTYVARKKSSAAKRKYSEDSDESDEEPGAKRNREQSRSRSRSPGKEGEGEKKRSRSRSASASRKQETTSDSTQ